MLSLQVLQWNANENALSVNGKRDGEGSK